MMNRQEWQSAEYRTHCPAVSDLPYGYRFLTTKVATKKWQKSCQWNPRPIDAFRAFPKSPLMDSN
jgi:hypothetical protein